MKYRNNTLLKLTLVFLVSLLLGSPLWIWAQWDSHSGLASVTLNSDCTTALSGESNSSMCLDTDNNALYIKDNTSTVVLLPAILGSLSFAEDAGAVAGLDMSVSATPAAATEESIVLRVDGSDFLKLYAEADSAGGLQNESVRAGFPFVLDVDARTIADSGDGNPATLTLDPISSMVQVTCNDAHTCDVTMSETSAADGQILTILNLTANVVDLADTSGVSELAGAFAMGQYDSATLQYVSDRWIELSRSDN